MTTTEQTLPPLPPLLQLCFADLRQKFAMCLDAKGCDEYENHEFVFWEAVRNALADMKTRKDAAYLERNRVVAALASQFSSGIARTAIEGWSEDWHGCVYIDLPTGQASWHYHDSHAHLFAHLPPYKGTWDGHTTEEKYERLSALSSICGESGKPKDARGCWNVRCQFSGSCVRNALATQAPALTDEQIDAIVEGAWHTAETETANGEAPETEWLRYGQHIARALLPAAPSTGETP